MNTERRRGPGLRRRPLLAAGFAALAVAGGGVVAGWYGRDMRRARRRVSAGSALADTACGPIEYASLGEGPPVLVVHGAGGGYDQALDIAGDALVGAGYRVIAPSRFGYLRTPLPRDASPAAQADAHACLLDALHIERAAVAGFSAGAPSAMQLALRHPERTSALVLVVPAAYPPHVERTSAGAAPGRLSRATQSLFDAAMGSDFVLWAALRVAPRTMTRAVLGTPPDLLQRAPAAERLRAARMLQHLLPFTRRRLGLLNDADVVPALPRYPLERIAAPTLVVSAEDDLYGTLPGARFTAAHVSGARLIVYPAGGHLLIGHMGEAMAAVAAFLDGAAVRA